MSKIAFAFPGQGSQSVGMGKSLAAEFKIADDTFNEANEVLGFDLKTMCFEGPDTELNKTFNTQPALLVTSIALLRVMEDKYDFKPALVLGHSLGEYTALVAAGALTFKDAVRLVHLRGKYMQEAVPEGTGGMAAIIGMDFDKIEEICKEVSNGDSIVVPANLNSPEQIVISGSADAVKEAGEKMTEAGAKKVVPLAVSAPSHSPLMDPAAVKLKAEMEKITIHNLKIPCVSNSDAVAYNEGVKTIDLLTRQLTGSVRWYESVDYLKTDGVTDIVEIGSGKVLTGLLRRITRDIKGHSVSEAADIEKIGDLLG